MLVAVTCAHCTESMYAAMQVGRGSDNLLSHYTDRSVDD